MVGLDIDGVLADFLSPFLSLVEKKCGNGAIPPDSITDFKFQEHPFLTEEIVWKCMEEVSYQPEFWHNLSSLVTRREWEALEELNRKRKLVFITNRYERGTYDIRQVTRDWLQKQGITAPLVHFTDERKGKLADQLGVSVFMDDRHENCEDVAEKTRAVVLMPHRSYNQSFEHPRVKRVWNFSELFGYLF
ncbi:MAG: hypothetical protein HY695_33160 [Deltaproteobacteria bacterium]|nr:hypothetical protein [Deltaproteobacteria bacterium]